MDHFFAHATFTQQLWCLDAVLFWIQFEVNVMQQSDHSPEVRFVGDAGLAPNRRIEIHIDRQRHTFIFLLIAQHVSGMWCAGWSCQYQVRLRDHYIQHLPAVADGFFRTPECAQLFALGQLLVELEAINNTNGIDGFADILASIARLRRQVRDRQVEYGDL